MKNYLKHFIYATAVIFMVVGCQRAPELEITETAVSINTDGIQTYTILPSNTDPSISQRPGEHIAYINPTIALHNQLVVTLPGTGATPDLYTHFGTTAAGVGFHTVGLVYENRGSISSRCKNSDEEQCAENARLEIINGTDSSSQVDVNQTNSIENRLLRLLQYLHAQHPADGWNQFYDDEALNWSEIVLVGHSQGGGHVGLLAREYVVARVIFFNSPSDFNATFGTTAGWIRSTHRTPAENYYAFFHQDDGGPKRVQVYGDLGMSPFGEPVDIDQSTNPYQQSHMLFTQIPSENPHVAVIGDPHLPLDNAGIPLYQNAWIYLLTN